MSDERHLATVELLGALTYGQLRAFEVSARAVRHAPDVQAADQLAAFAVREHEGYRMLRTHLLASTDLAGPVMDRQRPRFDEFFDGAPVEDWLGAVTFFAVGLPIAADFTRQVAPALDDETAEVLARALGDRDAFERFAQEQLVAAMDDGDDATRARARGLVADVLGRALTGFQAAVADTDALDRLLRDAGGEDADALVKRVAMSVIEGHRRRMHAIGLEDLD